MENTFKILVKP